MRMRITGEITRRHLDGKGNEKYINTFDTEKLKGNRNSDIHVDILLKCTSEELCVKI